jgi:parallel beta-helix repeat protein
LIAVAAVLALPALALAKTIKVSEGDDIQDVIDEQLEDGDTLVIGKGDYSQRISFFGFTGVTVKGKGARLNFEGEWTVALVGCTGVSVTGLDVMGTGAGVLVEESTDCTVTKVNVNLIPSNGILILDSTGTLVTKCTITNCATGIREEGTTETQIVKNTITDSTIRAMWLSTETGPMVDGLVSKNKCINNGSRGISFAATNTTIEKNTIDGSTGDGIHMDNSTQSNGCTISKNKLSNHRSYGMRIKGAEEFLVTGNKVFECTEGMWIRDSASNIRVEKNKFTGKESGSGDLIECGGTNCVISGNKFVNSTGIAVQLRVGVGGNTVTGNKIIGAGNHGIDVQTDSNIISNNKISKCQGHGIRLDSDNNEVNGNKAKKNGLGGDAFDCFEDEGAGGNLFENNKFGTESKIPE